MSIVITPYADWVGIWDAEALWTRLDTDGQGRFEQSVKPLVAA